MGNSLNALLIYLNHANRLVKFGVVNGTERVVNNVIHGILGGIWKVCFFKIQLPAAILAKLT